MLWWVLVSECYICTHLNIFQVIRKCYISGSHCIVNINVLGNLPYYRPLQNGGFGTVYISGSHCIVIISVWEVCPC